MRDRLIGGYKDSNLFMRSLLPFGLLISISCCMNSKDVIINKPFTWEQTTTCQVIVWESKMFGDNSAEVKECAELVKSAVSRTRRNVPVLAYNNVTETDAVKILGTIDSIFFEFGFLYFFDLEAEDLNFLTRSFQSTGVPEDSKASYKRIARFYRESGKTVCRRIDCDLYSVVYLGVLEMLGIPAALGVMPEHSLVTVKLVDGRSIFWETTTGHWETVTGRVSSDSGGVVIESRNETLSYFSRLIAWRFDYDSAHRDLALAKREYEHAIELSNRNHRAINDYVWLQIVNEQFSIKPNFPYLVSLMKRAIRLERRLSYVDTLAALYAEMGYFETAIEIQTEGLREAYDPDGSRAEAETHLQWFKKGVSVRKGKMDKTF